METANEAPKTQGLKFGIDLGTTYSSIGWYNPDTHQVQVAMLDSAQGTHLLPSAIYVEGPENVVVGNAAIHAGLQKPERLFRWFKRNMGNPPDPSHILDKRQWDPVECSAEILKTLKKEAEPNFSAEVKDVIITFPAWFDNRQKALTHEAAEKAGLNVIRMMEEPQAAALAYVIEEALRRAAQQSQNLTDLSQLIPEIIKAMAGGDQVEARRKAVMVFDLGGGTFDVALVQAWGEPAPDGTTKLHIKTLCNDGDITLGGKNWDDEIKQLVSTEDQAQHAHNFNDDSQAGRMDDACEQAKRDLARLTKVTVLCTKNHSIELTREFVTTKTNGLLDRARQISENVIARAQNEFGVPKENITLLLSGGMCRWPAVTEMLTKLMDGRAPTVPRNVDLMVTYGAAYLAYLTVTVEERAAKAAQTQAAEKAPDKKVPPGPVIGARAGGGISFVEHEAPYPAIGIELADQKNRTRHYVSRLIPTAPKLGEYYEGVYGTLDDDQTEVNITIYFLKEREGHKDDETDFAAWEKYETFTISGLPPMLAGQPIKANLKYIEGGIIEGKAWDTTGKEVKITGKAIC